MHSYRVRLAGTALLLLGASLAGEPAAAQPADPQAVHEELRALRAAMVDAWSQRDLDALLSHVHPNVVVTWQNGEVNRGHDEIRRFYDEVLGGEDSVIERIDSSLAMDELSILHGDEAAIAFGTIHDEITFKRSAAGAVFIDAGTAFALDSHWTASLAKKDGRWLLTAYHVSANIFSNPVLTLATSATRWIAGLVGLFAGILLTFLIARLLSRRSPARGA